MVSSGCCAYSYDIRWSRYRYAQGSGFVQSTLFFILIFCLRFLAYPYVWFCQTSFWCVSLLFLDKDLSFLLIFKQNEHLRIPTSLIIDLEKFSNINTKRPRRVPIQFDIIFIHLSVPSMLVMFVLFLRFCEVLFTWTCAWLFTIFYLFISSSRIPNLKKKKIVITKVSFLTLLFIRTFSACKWHVQFDVWLYFFVVVWIYM